MLKLVFKRTRQYIKFFLPNVTPSLLNCVCTSVKNFCCVVPQYVNLANDRYANACHPTFTDKKVHQLLVAIHFANTLTPFVKPCKVLRGYLDVAIAKICKTCMQFCAIDSQTCSFANFLQWLHLNNLAKKLSVKLAKNGHKNIWSVKVGVHLLMSQNVGLVV